jgi:hypothetical protein
VIGESDRAKEADAPGDAPPKELEPFLALLTSASGQFRQIDPLPTLSACPLRSDRVRTFAPQRFDAVVESRMSAVASAMRQRSVSHPRSSNRMCGFPASYDTVRLPPIPPPEATLRPLPSHQTGLPRLPEPPFRRAAPTTPADRAGAHVDCFPASRGLPFLAGEFRIRSVASPALRLASPQGTRTKSPARRRTAAL